MEIKLEIKKRNRDFGIVTWPYTLDFEVKTLFGLKENINIVLEGKALNNRKVSYKYRRFSLGKKRIEDLGKKRFLILSKTDNIIKISAK